MVPNQNARNIYHEQMNNGVDNMNCDSNQADWIDWWTNPSQHADDGGALVVGYVVEDLVDLGGVADLHLDRVRVLQGVELQRRDQRAGYELGPVREMTNETKLRNCYEQWTTNLQIIMAHVKICKVPKIIAKYVKYW